MAFNSSFLLYVLFFSSTHFIDSNFQVAKPLSYESGGSTMLATPSDAFRQIPFQLTRKLMVITAYVNGKQGNFIIDTGAEALTLNKKYFSGTKNPQAFGVDLAGSRIALEESQVQFGWDKNKSFKKYAIITDLTSIEKIIGKPIMGYIGYNILSDYEVYFNYDLKVISLITIDRKGNYIGKRPEQLIPLDSVPLKENASKPYLVAEVGGKKIRFGIDTGASRSFIRKGILRKINDQLEWQKNVLTAGFSGKVYESKRGIISRINIGQTNWNLIEVIVLNKWHSIDATINELDGMLGYDFIKQRTMGINFIKGQVYFLPNNAETDSFIIASSDHR